jgi:hypothetical protein
MGRAVFMFTCQTYGLIAVNDDRIGGKFKRKMENISVKGANSFYFGNCRPHFEH